MQVEEIFLFGEKNERKTGEFCYSMTITNSPLVANQNAGFALVHLYIGKNKMSLDLNFRIKRDFLKHKTIKVRDNKLNRRFGVDITPLSR